MTPPPLRLGIAGLGRGFMLLLPTLAAHPGIRLVAAADPREAARQQFASDFEAVTYADVAELCANPDVEAVYVATPHQFHREHVELAAAHGKHVLVEKPMALSLEDCQAMISAMRQARRWLMVGHSHSFDGPYRRTRELIDSGEFGAVRMIHALNFTDFLYRPRRPEELDTARGGGVVFSQAAHQVDIVRLLGGGRASSVRASTGSWDAARPTEGAYGALLNFEGGAFANMTYSGFAHFDSDEFCGWSGELGQPRAPGQYGQARRRLAQVQSPEEEAALKSTRTYGAGLSLATSSLEGVTHNHFGFVLVSCDHADLRPTPEGVQIYADSRQYMEPLAPPAIPRREVLDELIDAVRHDRAPIHSGEWGLATMEVCLGMLTSAATGRDVTLSQQVGLPHSPTLR
ncbi:MULTISPECIES: Gfo/Idh/MocA family oxidoreductase [Chromohalobacter]|uniref:Gfo/Idh/MocA family oxidoreductase n=1 Tax=Chromohalobacter TaxID=42054 RepID=UPI000FFE3787|nr:MULTISPECIES: Gfo/Idh/MocA family oxidoreductase [Chromohalobacter]NQY47257.1 Gfo/Idh/MocA family oxidoreductase [Chromohalobacter sp.]RXE46842.1 4,5-dihydroxyphthalate dehydrogenase [Chromohalobacter salexigens]